MSSHATGKQFRILCLVVYSSPFSSWSSVQDDLLLFVSVCVCVFLQPPASLPPLVRPFMTTLYLSHFQWDNATVSQSLTRLQLAPQTRQWVLCKHKCHRKWVTVKWPLQSPHLNPVSFGCEGMADWHHRCATDKSATAMWCLMKTTGNHD